MHTLLYKKQPTHTMALFRHSNIYIISLLENSFWLYGSTYIQYCWNVIFEQSMYVWLRRLTFPEKRCYSYVAMCVFPYWNECMCLFEDPDSVTVCPLSASEYDPTHQATPPWQRWEGQAFTNTAEGEGGGCQVDP